MSEQDMDKIKKLADGHTMTPRPEAWNKLRHKLKAKKAKQRMLAYRNIAVAAILISVLSVTAVFTMYVGNHNPKVFSSNEKYQLVKLENSTYTIEDPIFSYNSVNYIDQLNNAYSKIDLKKRYCCSEFETLP